MKHSTFLFARFAFAFALLFSTLSLVAANAHSFQSGRDKGDNDGYAHHDNHSAHYNSHHDRWEWRGPHKGCHVRGRHHHKHHGGHGKPAGQLDCSDAKANPRRLWPANHRFSNVSISGLRTIDGSSPEITIQCVYQDEPLNGIADGNTDVDAKFAPNGQLKLRKERARRRVGNGNGRVYHVDFEARDVAANESCEGSVALGVPHRWWGRAKDDGRLYVSLDNGFNCGGDGNQPPLITSDPENRVLGFRLLAAPPGMDISADGVVLWVPAQDDVGSHTVTLEVNDGENFVEQTYTLIVSERENTAPTFTSSPVIEAIEEQSYTYQLIAQDAEDDNFGFSLASGPPGLSVSLDGLVQWTPDNGQVGTHDITIEAIDTFGAVGIQSYTLTVAPRPNNAPEILSTPITSVNENETYQYVVLATDPEGSELSFRLLEAPAALVLESNALNWEPSFNDAGEYSVTIEVEDAEGATAAQTFLLTVVDVNRPPLFISAPVLAAAENTLYQYIPEVQDQDGDSVRIELILGPDGMVLNSDGMIEWMPGYDDAGVYSVEIVADDDRGGVTSDQFQVIVANTNRDPQITSTPTEIATENTLYSYQVEANDDDEQALVFSLNASPEGMTISDGGLIEWLPGLDDAGEATVELAVSDSESTITQAFVIVVDNLNQLPVADDQILTITEDTPASIILQASDGDADPLTYTIGTVSTLGAAILNNNRVDYTPPLDFSGIDSFTFVANDGRGDSDLAIVSVEVTAVNDAPTISFAPVFIAHENVLYSTDVDANDVEGDLLLYTLAAAPPGMTIDGSSGVITWVPSFDQAGDYPVMVNVTDTSGASDSFSYTLEVSNTNRAPVANDLTVHTSHGQALSVVLSGSDNDGDSISYHVQSQPVHGTLTGTAPNIVYTPNEGFTGSDSFSYAVNDGIESSSTATVSISVTAPNSVPEIESSPENVGLEGELYSYAVTAVDPDGDTLTYALLEAPVGMVIDALTGVIAWNTPVSGEHPVRVAVSDSFGVSVEQAYVLFVAPPLPPVTSSGTDFWMMFNSNLPFNDEQILFVTAEVATTVTISIPRLEYIQDYAVEAGEVLTVDLTSLQIDSRFGSANGRDDNAVRISANDPISAYFIHIANFSTDASILHPVQALGDHYIVGTYASQLNNNGALFGVVASEDNTTVTIVPSQRFEVDGVLRSRGEAYDVQLNRGETYQIRMEGLLDPSGTEILSDKPVAVFAGSVCTAVAVSLACDHLIEQLVPVPSLGARYFSVPLAERYLGDTFKIYAAEDDSYVFINGQIETYLDKGEYYEVILEGNNVIESNRPIQVMQFSNSADYDDAVDGVNDDFGDPFMLALPAEEQFVAQYTVTTPANGYQQNFMNLIVPSSAAHTVTIDGVVVDAALWQPVQDSDFVGAQLPIAAGQHTASAIEPFGLYIYGFDDFDSYGYLGGIAFSNNEEVSTVSLVVGDPQPEVGAELCITAIVQNAMAQPIAQAQVKFVATSTTLGLSRDYTDLTDLRGEATFCYERGAESQDIIVASAAGVSASAATIEWQSYSGGANLAPVFESLPEVLAFGGQQYSYQPVVQDPDGDDLEFSVMSDLVSRGLVIDAVSGLVTWTVPSDITPRESLPITIQVQDSSGNLTSQAFHLIGRLPGSAPVIVHKDISVAVQGQTVAATIEAVDPNYNEQLTWSVIQGEGNAAIDPVQGGFSWAANVKYPGSQTDLNASCRASGSSLESLEVIHKWFSDSLTAQGVSGPLYDSNQDGVLNSHDRHVLIAKNASQNVVAIDASNGEQIWESTEPVSTRNNSIGTLVNLDSDNENDSDAEFVYPHENSQKLIALNSDGSTRWITEERYANTAGVEIFGAVYPVDLNADGVTELLFGSSVFDRNGNRLWGFPQFPDVDQFAVNGMMLAVDFDLDGIKEVVFNEEVRDWQGNLLWSIPSSGFGPVSESHFSYANIDTDPYPELIVNSRVGSSVYRLQLIDDDGVLLWDIPASSKSAITTADFDGDGIPDIYLPGSGTLYSADGSIIWSHQRNQNNVGATIADLDADGTLDIVQYVDDSLFVFDGATGALSLKLNERRPGSRLRYMHQVPPAFVDIDQDGQGELITAGRADLKVLEAANDDWVPAALVHAYLNQHHGAGRANLVPDNTIGLALYGQSSAPAALSIPAASAARLSDIVLNSVSANPADTGWKATLAVANRGLKDIPAGTVVEFYKDDETVATNKVGEVVLEALTAGAGTTSVSWDIPNIDDLGQSLIAKVKPSSTLQECLTENNIVSSQTMLIQVEDFDGLTDVEAWSVGATFPNERPTFTSTPPAVDSATVGETLQYQVQAVGALPGDEIRYSLGATVNGASINALTGLFTWTPANNQVGVQTLFINARDFRGSAAIHVFVLDVQPSSNVNQPPQISSTPLLSAVPNFSYTYRVLASDPDGEYLNYSLSDAPAGLTINQLTGRIQWVPTETDIGVHSVTIEAIDGLGEIATQTFSITVRANSIPEITSNPSNSIVAGTVYSYQLIANDADFDALTYSLTEAPTGMTISQSGLVIWDTAAQILGGYPVELKVSDGVSHVTQRFVLEVTDDDGSGAGALILSNEPKVEAFSGESYQYWFTGIAENGGAVTIELISGPTGMNLSANTPAPGYYQLSWLPDVANCQCSVVLRLSDTSGNEVQVSFTIDIYNAPKRLNRFQCSVDAEFCPTR